MKILALEFSTRPSSVAFLHDNGFSVSQIERPYIFPAIEGLLGSQEPDFIAIGLGPGSYTGIRSALAIAQGWHLSKNILATGISSAEAHAFEAWSNNVRGEVEVTIDAQRGEVYSVVYNLTDEGVKEVEPLEIRKTPRSRGKLICAETVDHQGVELAFWIGQLAEQPGRDFVSPEKLEPIYLRETTFVKAPPPRHL